MSLPQVPDRDPDEHFETDTRYVSFEPLVIEEEFRRYLKDLPKHIPAYLLGVGLLSR